MPTAYEIWEAKQKNNNVKPKTAYELWEEKQINNDIGLQHELAAARSKDDYSNVPTGSLSSEQMRKRQLAEQQRNIAVVSAKPASDIVSAKNKPLYPNATIGPAKVYKPAEIKKNVGAFIEQFGEGVGVGNVARAITNKFATPIEQQLKKEMPSALPRYTQPDTRFESANPIVKSAGKFAGQLTKELGYAAAGQGITGAALSKIPLLAEAIQKTPNVVQAITKGGMIGAAATGLKQIAEPKENKPGLKGLVTNVALWGGGAFGGELASKTIESLTPQLSKIPGLVDIVMKPNGAQTMQVKPAFEALIRGASNNLTGTIAALPTVSDEEKKQFVKEFGPNLLAQGIMDVVSGLGTKGNIKISDLEKSGLTKKQLPFLKKAEVPGDTARMLEPEMVERINSGVGEIKTKPVGAKIKPNIGKVELAVRGLQNLVDSDTIKAKTAINPDLPEAKTIYDTPKIIAQRKAQEQAEPTSKINTPERIQLRKDIENNYYGNGAVNKNAEAVIVIGLPGSGKSSIANPLAEETGALVVDADKIREQLPEFKETKNAYATQDEASSINGNVLAKAIQNRDNVVLPIVGKTLEKINATIDALKEGGYKVHVKYVDLPIDETVKRAVVRWEAGDQGFVDPDYIVNKVGDNPKNNYYALKNNKGVDSYEFYSNDVPKGQKPILIESSRTEVPAGAGGRRLGGQDNRGDQEGNGHAATKVNPTQSEPGIFMPETEVKKAEVPIDERNYEDVSKRNVKSYQYDHPEVADHIQAEAIRLIGETNDPTFFKGQKIVTKDYEEGAAYRNFGITKNVGETFQRIQDATKATYPQINKALEDIANNRGSENYALAKKIELIIDDNLTKGTTDVRGNQIEPDADYIAKKKQIEGGQNGLQRQEEQGETGREISPVYSKQNENVLGIVAKPKLPFLKQTEPRAKTMVVNETSEVSPTINKIVTNKKGRMPMRTLWDNFYQKFINNQHYIGLAQKTAGQAPANKDMAIMAANSRNAPGTVNHILREALVTKEGKEIGNSYKDIIDSVPRKYEQEFNDYLLHRHNIGRMSLQENAEAKVREFELGNPSLASLNDTQLKKLSEVNGDEGVAAKEYLELIKNAKKSQNKPVFSKEITPEISEQQIAKYEAKFPDFKRIADQYDSFNQKFMKEWAVKTGSVSEDTMKHLNEIYPHYTPTYRAMEETAATQIRPGKGFTNQPNVLKKATGSERPILNPLETTIQLVDKTVKAAKYNEVGQTIVDAIRKDPEGMKEWGEIVQDPGADLVSDTGKTLENSDIGETMDNFVSQYDKPKLSGKNIVRVMIDGKPVYLKINKPEFLESITGLINYKPGEAEKIARMVTTPYKALITGKNPIFAVKNIARDIPTAYINGSEKNPFKFIKNLSEAAKDMATNAETFREYKALGGGNSGFFLEGNAKKSNLKKLYKGEGAVSQFNESIESLPRYAEYKRTVKRGGGDYASKMQGIFNANELTVNFARHGNVTKSVDAIVPYLNPSVQGLDKLARQFQKNPLATIGKGILIVTIPQIALNLINRDNDEYKKLDNRTKDNYYLIPNVADGGKTFIKIPKSREYGVIFADTFDRIQRGLKGEQRAFDGYLDTVAINFAPTNPLENNYLSPIITNLPSNKDFAGRTIVPQGIQSRSPKYQYDENTSEISKAIGQKLNISPKQADYLIKSYTGVIGTFTLPMTTKSSKGTIQQIIGNTVSRNFTADPVFSNDIVNRFYERKKKAETIKADAKFNNKELSMTEDNKRHQYNVAASEISKIYDQIGVAKTDDEKRNLRKQINEIAKIATESPVDDEVKETKNDVLEKLGIKPESKQKFY